MKLEKLASINQPFENIAGKLYNLYDKYILEIEENSLNFETPLLSEEEWRNNSRLIGVYSINGLMITGLAFTSLYLAGKEFFSGLHHFIEFGSYILNNQNEGKDSYIFINEMAKNLGKEIAWGVVEITSLNTLKKTTERIVNLIKKRENKYNLPRPF